MRINQNMAALNAWRNLTVTDGMMSKSLERLSSGYRINRAADDAAGLAISEKMRGQIGGLRAAQTNAMNGISLIQTAEGALSEVHSMLQRMRELAVQASNDTMTDGDRGQLQKEIDNLLKEIDRIANDTEFNTRKLLNGDLSEGQTARGTKLQSVEIRDGANNLASGGTTLASATDIYSSNFQFVAGTTYTIVVNATVSNTQYAWSFTVSGGDTLTALAGLISNTVGSLSSVTFNAATGKFEVLGLSGAAYALSNFKLSATQNGTAMNLFNERFSGLQEIQAAQDVSSDKSLTLHIGANANQTARFGVQDMRVQALALKSVSVLTKTTAGHALAMIDAATEVVSTARAGLGAMQNRLEHTIQNLGVAVENLTAAESRVRDVDMALEMTVFTRSQILMQAGTAMLAQANQKPQSVLQLLR